MPSARVIKAVDVLKDGGFGLAAGFLCPAPDQLGLDRIEERLDNGTHLFRVENQPQGHPLPGAAKARWSALSAPLLCEIHPSCLCPRFISFAAQYVIKGAA